jgi:hypothetical protein
VRRYSVALCIGGIGSTAVLWWWLDDAGFFPMSFLPSLVLLPIAGAMFWSGSTRRLLLVPLGLAGGLVLAVALGNMLSRISDAWAEAALRSAVAAGQGAEVRPWLGAPPDCALPDVVPSGELEVLHRDDWFGKREFLVRLPGGPEAFFSFARSGSTWECVVEMKAGPHARTRPNKALQLTSHSRFQSVRGTVWH